MLHCTIKQSTINQTAPAAINHKGNNMYDFFKPIELNRAYQQTEKAIKDAYDFWLGVISDTFKLYKTK